MTQLSRHQSPPTMADHRQSSTMRCTGASPPGSASSSALSPVLSPPTCDGNSSTARTGPLNAPAHQALALAAAATGDFGRASSHAFESLRRFDPRTMSRAGFLMPDVWVGVV